MSNLDKLKSNQEGRCPICNSMKIDYGSLELDGNSCYYPCECLECKAKWNEVYEMIFATVDDVVDNEGNEYNSYN